MPNQVKSCFRCKQEKDVSEFNKNKATRDGYSVYCKACRSSYAPRRSKKEYARLFSEGLKQCQKCGTVKPFDDFYVMKDGAVPSICKDCSKAYAKTQEGKEIAKRYYQSPRRKAAVKEYTSRPDVKRRINDNHKWYAKDNPDKSSARRAVGDAIKSNKMPPAKYCKCVICNQQARDYHHYLGYDRCHRLDVIPVCRTCHPKLDKGEIEYTPSRAMTE